MISPKAERNHLAFPVPPSTSTLAALLPATHPTALSQSPTSLAMDTAIDLSDASKALDLANIRFQLIRLEDTITFHLIERAQFPLNKPVYIPGGVNIPGTDLSLLDYFLRERERLESRVRRYQSPDEYPFFPDALEEPILAPIQYPKILHDNDVNVNSILKQRYIEDILPAVCAQFGREDRGETQENYGSAATCDVHCLQALSRRIHFGKFVAEAKFQQETERFVKLIKANDRKGIDEAITKPEVELKVLERLALKAKTYGTDPGFQPENGPKINVDAVVAMYKEYVIPLTKVVEVDYLMQRLKGTQWE
ncbi:chorismate mutase ARO7 [Aspergillus vadensis CBS 113365]|uniref:Chorismate mutase n=1 Tax=Aspergillus vadensis (strain CBS 113365 / IMI 142717 / IBT 24658) TaxID=1448311 RepID=A0A319BK28_ASPVC|nr:chorismate mutase [Aspergillus vadensis CBS 113365]PYH73065.1 chorismate mutase [Aspergillus vadensis CBS 113365]